MSITQTITKFFKVIKKMSLPSNQMIDIPYLEKENHPSSLQISREMAGDVGEIRIHGPCSFSPIRGYQVQFEDNSGRYLFATKHFPSLEEAKSVANEILNLLTDFADGNRIVIVVRGWKDFVREEQPPKGWADCFKTSDY